VSIKFYNTLSRKLEIFKPIEKKTVKIYSCGPTVYNYAHIGNFRSYIFNDLLRRFLLYEGYKVIQVMNITDVDDKTITGANQQKIPLKEYTDQYTKAFFEDMETLGIEKVEYYPKATDHIDDMIELIRKLEKKGYIYVSEGSVYFKISEFKDYGKLSNIDPKGMKDGVRIDADEYTKDNAKDFVLWKKAKEGEPSWETEYGKGRPGWHIECSAMSFKFLGETFDIHTGGVDLVFPHHENEIAQSEAANEKPFVRYWIHCAHLIVDGEKMSKSKGNYYTLRDLVKKGYSPLAIRYLLLSTHYRKQVNFTSEGLQAAQSAVNRIQNFYINVKEQKTENIVDHKFNQVLKKHTTAFNTALEDDLNISEALGHFFELMTDANKFMTDKKLTESDKRSLLEAIISFNTILNILDTREQDKLPAHLQELIEKREKARKSKDYKLSDELRDRLKEENIILEDTTEGVKWKVLK